MQRFQFPLVAAVVLGWCSIAGAGSVELCNSPGIVIPDAGIPDDLLATDVVTVDAELSVEEVKVQVKITHAFIGDLAIAITSPSGTFLQVYGGEGEDEIDMSVTFSDSGAEHGTEAWTCGCEMQPMGPEQLDVFIGESSAGDWTLTVGDFFPPDEGTLESWCLLLEGCGQGAPTEVACTLDDNDVKVSWTNPSSTPDSLVLFRNGKELASLSVDETGYSDPDLAPGLYTYYLVATNDAEGCGATSDECTALIGADTFCAKVPKNFITFDADPVIATLEIEEDLAPLDVIVDLAITHTWVGDLLITVESPDGASISLFDKDLGSPDTEEDDMILSYADDGVPHASVPFACGCYMQPVGPALMSDLIGKSSAGTWTLSVDDTFADDDGTLDSFCVTIVSSPIVVPPLPVFLRGDVNGSGDFAGLSDGLYLLRYGFVSGDAPPCLEAADADGNGTVGALADSLYILRHAFTGGPAPPAPYPDCGSTEIQISCETEPDCN